MKKNLLLSILVLFSVSCQKFEPEPIAEDAQSSEKSTSATLTLSVTSLTERALKPGSTFIHEITLKAGSIPIPNEVINIDDPFSSMCTFVTTNSQGKAIWKRTTKSTTKPEAYTIKFYARNKAIYSTVAVKPKSALTLSTYKIDFESVAKLDDQTLVGGSRGGIENTTQSISKTLANGVKLGKDVANDYLSDPKNKLLVSVTALSCDAATKIPEMGEVCAASAIMLIDGYETELVKTIIKQMIDKTTFDSKTKSSLKTIVDLGSTALSINSLIDADGAQVLKSLPLFYELLSTNACELIYYQGKLRGASISVPLKNRSDVLNCSFYQRK